VAGYDDSERAHKMSPYAAEQVPRPS
jgi:hypothetical protein